MLQGRSAGNDRNGVTSSHAAVEKKTSALPESRDATAVTPNLAPAKA
jgi:hypothetical protein